MSNRYSPVRVCNPISENHLVYLHPGQSLELHIEPWMKVQDVDTSTECLNLVDERIKEDGTVIYEYYQKENYSKWAAISNTFLGEILLIGQDSCTSVCIVLQSQNDDVLTVINPSYAEVKAHAHQTIEVVFWDAEAYPHLVPKINAGMGGLIYKEIGHEIISATGKIVELANRLLDGVQGFVVSPRNDEYKEHHFWFELDVKSLLYLSTLGRGTYWGGRIEFSDGGTSFVVNITLNVRKRKRMRGAKKKSKARTAVARPQSSVTHVPKRVHRSTLALCREVTLTAIGDSLEEGCKVLSSEDIETFMVVETAREAENKWRSNAWLEYD